MNTKDEFRNLMRYIVLVVIIGFFSFFIMKEVFSTTITHKADWDNKADSVLMKRKILYPTRGDILACDGSVLATNITYYTVRVDYRSQRFMEERYKMALDSLSDSMATYFGKTKEYWKEYLKKPLEKPKEKRSRCYKIVGNISYTEYQKLRTFPFFNIPNRNKCGLVLDSKMRRRNPYGEMALRSIGLVGEDKKGEIHGVWGLERDLDSLLYGKPGVARIVPVNRNTLNWTDTPAVDGYTIKTTIDINMQDIVENELNKVLADTKADWGVAILMDVATGDIRAISNLEMDPQGNGYIEGMNRAILGFEPGSVMKPISMLIALDKGWVKNPNDIIVSGNRYKYANGPAISDCSPVASMPIWEIIERSSNVAMTKLMMPHIDSAAMFKHYLKEIGFLDPMNLHIAGERIPRIRDVGNSNWDFIDVSRMTYGYTTQIPPIYTLSIYNAIANGGRYVRPRFVTNLIGNGVDSIIPVSYMKDRICSEKNAEILKEMLTRVVWGEHGTARRVLRNDVVKIAGKTGTCYATYEKLKQDKETGQLITKDIYGRDIPQGTPGHYDKDRKRLSFCGFFPVENPQYSCFVMIFHPKNGVGAAASSGVVLKEIALKMYSRGMLGNESDYRAEKNAPSRPILYATQSSSKHSNLKEGLSMGKIARLPDVTKTSGVPSVKGLGLREAIVALETAGYNVDFDGMGYVVAQTPVAGDIAPQGSCVKLKLTEF